MSKRVSTSSNSNNNSLSQNIINSLTPSSIATALLSSTSASTSSASSSSSSSSSTSSSSNTISNNSNNVVSSSNSAHTNIAANANSNTPSPSIIHKTISNSRSALSSSATSNRSSTSSGRNLSERSNEVPPSNTSAGIVTLRQTSTSSTSSRSANDFAAHFDNIDPPLTQPITPPSSSAILSSNSNSNATNYDDITKRNNELSIMQRMKKRPLTGLLNPDNDSELICPICFDIIRAAHVTKCGHSFCQSCIQTALEHSHRCPKCNTSMSMSRDVFPNFALNQIIERFKEETNSKKVKFNQTSASTLIEYFNSAQEDLGIDEINVLLNILTQRREELKMTNEKVTEYLLHDFLKHLQQVKTDELNKIQHELNILNEDCKQVEETLKSLIPNLNESQTGNDSKSETKALQVSSPDSNLEQKLNDTLTNSNAKLSSPDKLQMILSNRKRIVHRYFDELSSTYVHANNKDLKEFSIIDTTKNASVLDQIRYTVSKITNCSEFKSIASVNYNSDSHTMSSIVSSVDFDSSYEHFAIAGVTKRIKIYDFHTIVNKQQGVHYPLYEMNHNSKLSCISWNRYFRQQLACSDYDGVVSLWDVESQSLMRSYQEHEKRCWSVNFCDMDPRLIASASDDSKVKIWSTNSEYSLLSIDAKSNVCCVVFKPQNKFNVLFGTADHSIHYYDLRNPKEPVSLFKGHKKAVSYVKFTNDNEFVSASTDSNLKLWRLNEGQCIRSFTGHVNEKNFVGLDTHDGYVITGSENNTVYLYCNEISKPVLTYKFDEGNQSTKKDETVNDFVSAVCWSNQNYVLAANSQGIVKILELV